MNVSINLNDMNNRSSLLAECEVNESIEQVMIVIGKQYKFHSAPGPFTERIVLQKLDDYWRIVHDMLRIPGIRDRDVLMKVVECIVPSGPNRGIGISIGNSTNDDKGYSKLMKRRRQLNNKLRDRMKSTVPIRATVINTGYIVEPVVVVDGRSRVTYLLQIDMGDRVVSNCLRVVLLSHVQCRVMRPIMRLIAGYTNANDAREVAVKCSTQAREMKSRLMDVDSHNVELLDDDPYLFIGSGNDTIKEYAKCRTDQILAQCFISDVMKIRRDGKDVRDPEQEEKHNELELSVQSLEDSLVPLYSI